MQLRVICTYSQLFLMIYMFLHVQSIYTINRGIYNVMYGMFYIIAEVITCTVTI